MIANARAGWSPSPSEILEGDAILSIMDNVRVHVAKVTGNTGTNKMCHGPETRGYTTGRTAIDNAGNIRIEVTWACGCVRWPILGVLQTEDENE